MYGSRLKFLRTEKDLTQDKVAERVGLSRVRYNQYESERRAPDFETLLKLADFFECSTDYLLGRTNNQTEILVPPEPGQSLIGKAKDANVSISELEAYIEARKKVQNTKDS